LDLARQLIEVFLLLFLQKKKTLPLQLSGLFRVTAA